MRLLTSYWTHTDHRQLINENLIRPAFAPDSRVREMVDAAAPLLLCTKHYQHVYNLHKPAMRKCATCGAVPKPGKKFTHHCSNSEKISAHLSIATGTEVTISLSCYMTHLSIKVT